MFDGFFSDLPVFLPVLLDGIATTLLIGLAALCIATVLGLVWALMRQSQWKPIAHASRVLTNVIRGVPLIVVLFYLYFVMPEMGLQLSAFQAGAMGLGLTYSAYMSEVFRAGIEAIDRGQMEAAQSLGMSRWMAMKRVILPQAIKISLPPYGNNMVMMLKDTSQTSVITVVELSMQGKLLALSTFKSATVFTMVAVIYLLMCLPLMYVAGRLERRLKKSQ